MSDLKQDDWRHLSIFDRVKGVDADLVRGGLDLSRDTYLKASIERDLKWLLSATNLEATQRLDAFPHVQSSVLNYGLPPSIGSFLADGRGSDGNDREFQNKIQSLKSAIEEVIFKYEPRVISHTLKVKFTGQDDEDKTLITFEITAKYHVMPAPIYMYFKTKIKPITGEVILGGDDG